MICFAQTRSFADEVGRQVKIFCRLARRRDAGRLDRPADDQVTHVRQRGDARAAGAAARVRPVVRTNQVFVGAVDLLDERGGDLVLAGLDENRLGAQRRLAAAVGAGDVDQLIRDQRDALAINRNVDVLEARVLARVEGHLELVFAVRGEDVVDDHAAARAERRARDAIPRVLRHVGRVGVGVIDRRRRLVADRHAADVRRGVEVRLEQRRRQRLLVGDVVEVRAHRVARQPLAGVDVELEQILDGARVLGTIEALERAAAGIRVGLGVHVHGRFERANEILIGRRVRTRHARRRHHARLQLADHPFGDVGVLARLREIKRRERETARAILVAIAVAADAVLLDERVVVGRRAGVRRARCGLLGRVVRDGGLGGRDDRLRHRGRLRRGLLGRDCCDESQAQNRGAEGDGTGASHSKIPTHTIARHPF